MKAAGITALICILIAGVAALADEAAVEKAAAEKAAVEKAAAGRAVAEKAAVEKAVAGKEPAAKTARMDAVKSYFGHVRNKFTIGATNMLRSGTEFYYQPVEAKNKTGKDISMLWPGLGEAFGMALTRLLGGAIDAATSPLPFPNGWQPILNE